MIRAIVALLACILTGVQAVFIIMGKDGICLNEGCKIVDTYPKVPPIFFNSAGFIFFLILFICFVNGRKGSEYWHRFAKLLLLTGLAAEGVLVFFQYSIVTAFCSYCLIIFSLILLLNLLCGLRQFFSSMMVFSVVFVMLLSLELRAVSNSDMSLDTGSYAAIGEESEEVVHYLFFSETCEHCENILSLMEDNNKCSFRFNPIDRINHFSLSDSSLYPEYDPGVNISFLKSLKITEIPVLVVAGQERVVVLKGEGRIRKYLDEQCLRKEEIDVNGTSQNAGSYRDYLNDSNQLEGGCSVEEDCGKLE